MTSPGELQAQADALHWYHTIDLGNGVVTKGDSAQDDGTGILPDVTGRTVLDIGAWDGKYSFQAERSGASRANQNSSPSQAGWVKWWSVTSGSRFRARQASRIER